MSRFSGEGAQIAILAFFTLIGLVWAMHTGDKWACEFFGGALLLAMKLRGAATGTQQ